MTSFHNKAALSGQLPLFVPESKWVPPAELPSLAGIKRLTLDCESKDSQLKTLGPGWRRGAKIVGLALGADDGRRWYLPTGHAGGGNLDERIVKEWAREELGGFTGEVLGANLGYDLDGLATDWDVHLTQVKAFHDVQIAEPLIDEWRREYNLDALSFDYLGEGKDERLLLEAGAAYGFTTKDQIKSNLWRFPAHLVGPYAEGDVDRPERIFKLQLKKLELEDQLEVYRIERRLVPLLVAMRRRGVRVNLDKVDALRLRFTKEVKRWEAELRRFAGPTAELRDPESLAKALANRGVHVPRTPKTGVPSITKPFLEQHQKDELVKVILNGRKFQTLISTFLDSQIAGHAINGRVHPTFKQGKDDDGGSLSRFAGSNPNLQFIPARESDWQEDQNIAPLIRGIFEPEEGEEWQRDDYSQIEYRLLVDTAVGRGAEEARERYRNDPKTDYHKFVAEMLKVSPEDKVKRKKVKNTNFAKGYGAQAPRLALTFGCSVEEAEEFIAEYDRELPFAKTTFDKAAYWGQRQGFVTTVLGRKQRFPFWGPANYKRHVPGRLFKDREEAVEHYLRQKNVYRGYPVWRIERVNVYMALNRKLQGGCADLMKKSMGDAHEAGITAPGALGPFLVTVHDELGSSVPPTRVGDEAGRELVQLMQNAVKLKVPVLVESERGANWGECK